MPVRRLRDEPETKKLAGSAASRVRRAKMSRMIETNGRPRLGQPVTRTTWINKRAQWSWTNKQKRTDRYMPVRTHENGRRHAAWFKSIAHLIQVYRGSLAARRTRAILPFPCPLRLWAAKDCFFAASARRRKRDRSGRYARTDRFRRFRPVRRPRNR